MISKRIILYVPSITHPRFHKRAKEFLDNGYDVEVYGFDRNYNNNNQFSKGIKVHCLGDVENGRYFKRIFTLFFALIYLLVSLKNKKSTDVHYTFGLDMAYIAFISSFGSGVFIYEIGDLRNPGQSKGFKSRVLSVLELGIVRHASKVIVTSAGFIEGYFSNIGNDVATKCVVVENKLTYTDALRAYKREPKEISGIITIGFVGVLRYVETLLPLLEAVAQNNRFKLNIHGDGDLKSLVEKYSSNYENINYYGRFSYPDDLIDIYHAIDLNYVVYNNLDENVRLALPNKLYESSFFCVPMVVADNTYLEKRVLGSSIGYSVSIDDGDFAKNMLLDITIEKLLMYSKNCLSLPEEELFMHQSEVISNILD